MPNTTFTEIITTIKVVIDHRLKPKVKTNFLFANKNGRKSKQNNGKAYADNCLAFFFLNVGFRRSLKPNPKITPVIRVLYIGYFASAFFVYSRN